MLKTEGSTNRSHNKISSGCISDNDDYGKEIMNSQEINIEPSQMTVYRETSSNENLEPPLLAEAEKTHEKI